MKFCSISEDLSLLTAGDTFSLNYSFPQNKYLASKGNKKL